MVLRFETEPDEVYFIDAVGNRGVGLNKWSFIKKHYGKGKFYSNIVFRHIEIERSNQMIDALELFLKEAIGQKYGIGKFANKIFRK